LRTLNWPQATFDTTKGALIVEASWYEDDLNLYSLHQIFTQPRFEKWGETELSKFMGYVKEQEQWSNLDSREYEDWGLNLFSKYTTEEGMKRTLNVFSQDGDDSLYTNSSTDFCSRDANESRDCVVRVLGRRMGIKFFGSVTRHTK
jgi:hypothetical protein